MSANAQEWIASQLGELETAYAAEGAKLADETFLANVHLVMTGAEAFNHVEGALRERLSGLGIQPQLVEHFVGVTCRAFIARSLEIRDRADFAGGNA